MAAAEVLHYSIALLCWGFGIDGCNIDACSFQSADLIFHKGKKRRNDDGNAMVYHGRKLKAERFSKGGGSLDEDIVAFECGGDDFALVRPVRRVRCRLWILFY